MQQLMKQTFLGNNIILRINLFRVLGLNIMCDYTLFSWFDRVKKLFNIVLFHLQSQTVYQRIASKEHTCSNSVVRRVFHQLLFVPL